MACGLNGSNQFLTVPVDSAFEFGTGDFTVACKALFGNTNPQPILCLGRGAVAGTAYCAWLLVYISGILYWYQYTPTETSVSIAWAPSANTIYDFAVTRTSGTLRILVNASQLLSVPNTTNYNRVNNDNLGIGYQESGAGVRYLNGQVSEVGIWKAGLTDAEITALARGFTADQIRPQSLSFYAPLVRNFQDVRGGLVITNNNGATVATHPRIIT
jgi:hypothetical protein